MSKIAKRLAFFVMASALFALPSNAFASINGCTTETYLYCSTTTSCFSIFGVTVSCNTTTTCTQQIVINCEQIV